MGSAGTSTHLVEFFSGYVRLLSRYSGPILCEKKNVIETVNSGWDSALLVSWLWSCDHHCLRLVHNVNIDEQSAKVVSSFDTVLGKVLCSSSCAECPTVPSKVFLCLTLHLSYPFHLQIIFTPWFCMISSECLGLRVVKGSQALEAYAKCGRRFQILRQSK